MNFITLEEGESAPANSRILFKTANEFSIYITELAAKKGDTLVCTLLDYCEQYDVDPTDISKLISRTLKDRLEVEYQQSGLLKKESTASFDEEVVE
jgi:hypothetical protein